jgi:hypothetical protein
MNVLTNPIALSTVPALCRLAMCMTVLALLLFCPKPCPAFAAGDANTINTATTKNSSQNDHNSMIAENAVSAAQWQTGLRVLVHGGVSVPMFDYARLPMTIADFTPQEERTPAGAAMLGATLGATAMYRLHPSVAVIGSLDVNYNPYNVPEAEKQLRTSIGAINLLGLNINLLSSALASILQTSSSYSAQAHWNGTLTAGLRYDFQIVPAILSAYVAGEVGAFYGVYPQTASKLNLTIPLFGINAEIINSVQATGAASFAWAVSGGLLVSERVNLGVRFVSANPLYTSVVSTVVNSSGGASGTIVIPGIGRISSQEIVASVLGAFPERSAPFFFPTAMLQCTVGYVF